MKNLVIHILNETMSPPDSEICAVRSVSSMRRLLSSHL